MIVDTSAVLAILFNEDDAPQYAQAIETAATCQMSAANFLEAAINVDHRGDAIARRQLDIFIERAQIDITPVTFEQARMARQAYIDYGKGNHPAGLNVGSENPCCSRVMTFQNGHESPLSIITVRYSR
jgi:ribonuclease VapC